MGRVSVHIVPRARQSAVTGPYGEAIKIRIAAPPVDGAANAELVRFIAERLAVPLAHVTIVSGAGGRRKTVAVAGVESTALRSLLLAV